MHSRALDERICVLLTDMDGWRVPGRLKGVPVYTLKEINLLAEGVKAGDLQRVADLLLLHSAKEEAGGRDHQMNHNLYEIVLTEPQMERITRIAQGVTALGYDEQVSMADMLNVMLVAGLEYLEQRLGLPEVIIH